MNQRKVKQKTEIMSQNRIYRCEVLNLNVYQKYFNISKYIFKKKKFLMFINIQRSRNSDKKLKFFIMLIHMKTCLIIYN